MLNAHKYTHTCTHTLIIIVNTLSIGKPSTMGDSLTVGGPLISSGEVSQHSMEQARGGSRSGSPETISDKKLNKPSTPPPPQEAFEEFKKTRGVNINQILIDSKGR